MVWWVIAVFPILFSVLPVKEMSLLGKDVLKRYERIRDAKVWLLRVSIAVSLIGVVQFAKALTIGGWWRAAWP